MARRSSPCTQADITRLIKGALAAGLTMDKISGVQLTRQGAILLFGAHKQWESDQVVDPVKADDSWSDVDAA
jgi:hypothetical protein